MSDAEFEEYVKDKRIACKYGAKCYQKNPAHSEKYKHPPKKVTGRVQKPPAKKKKIETPNNKIKEIKIINDISDSESEPDHTKKPENNNKKEVVSETDESDDNEATSDEDSDEDGETTPANFDVKEFIKEKFLFDMPDDFYEFWELCKKLKPANPSEALKEVGLLLVGVFDVLAGKFNNAKIKSDYLVHWRYFHDPPEFQTVLKGDDKTGYHIGYWRDSPKDSPVFMACNKAKVDGTIQTIGENIFSAVNIYLENYKKSVDPFKKMQVGRVHSALLSKAKELKLDISPKTDKMRARNSLVVSKTFNKIGLVVPYNKKTQLGWRELTFNNNDLTKIFNKLAKAEKEQETKYLSELQPCLTYASIAIDECDFGTGIELGWNIIAHGINCLNSTALRFLKQSYDLLGKSEFGKIAEAHMNKRRKGTDLSVV